MAACNTCQVYARSQHQVHGNFLLPSQAVMELCTNCGTKRWLVAKWRILSFLMINDHSYLSLSLSTLHVRSSVLSCYSDTSNGSISLHQKKFDCFRMKSKNWYSEGNGVWFGSHCEYILLLYASSWIDITIITIINCCQARYGRTFTSEYSASIISEWLCRLYPSWKGFQMFSKVPFFCRLLEVFRNILSLLLNVSVITAILTQGRGSNTRLKFHIVGTQKVFAD